MQIQISTLHGSLTPEQLEYVQEKADKLVKIFGRLMAIEVLVERRKNEWHVEILGSAEHKHDFVADQTGPSVESAMDHCVQKIESQLRRYKEKVQGHRDSIPHGGTSPRRPDLPEPPLPN